MTNEEFQAASQASAAAGGLPLHAIQRLQDRVAERREQRRKSDPQAESLLEEKTKIKGSVATDGRFKR